MRLSLGLSLTRGNRAGEAVPYVPTASNTTATVIDETSASLTVDVNSAPGTIYGVAVNTSSGTINPDATEVQAGQDGNGDPATWDHNQGTSETGTQTFAGGITGLTEGEEYIAYTVFVDDDLNVSAVDASDPFTPADVTAPIITSHDVAVSDSYGYSGSFNTDDDTGVVDIVLTASSTTPSATQIKAGQDHTGAAAVDVLADQAVSATGPQAYSGSDLDGGLTLYAHAVHTDENGNESNTLTSSASFSTAAAAVPDAFVDADWSVATSSSTGGKLDITIATLPDRNGSDITDVEYDVDASGTWISLPSYAGTGTYTVTMAAASTSYDIRLRAVNSVGNGAAGNTEAASSSASGAGETPNVFPATWAGQSLAFGTGGTDALGASQYNGIMLDGGMYAAGTPGTTFVTMDESFSTVDAGETGWADGLAEIIETEDSVLIANQGQEAFVHNVARGNTEATDLLGNSTSYEYFLADLPAISSALTAGSKTLRSGVWPTVRRQGERDQILNTDTGIFKGILYLEQTLRMSDLSRVFSATINPDIITYQFASHCDSGVGTGTPSISLALLDLCREEGSPFYLSNPLYYLPHSDGVHLASVEYRRLGSAEALMGKRLYWDNLGSSLEPLAIRAAWTSGNNIVLRYAVESGRTLELDTTQVTSQTNSGFELYESDGTTPITITGVSVTGSNEVTLTTGSARSAGEIVRYAYTGTTDTTGPTNGPRGNLRDDSGDVHTRTIDSTSYRLDRWAAIDEFTVSGSSGEPAAWSTDPHTVKSLATIASDYSLDGLFDLHTDADTARFNHGQTGNGLKTFTSSGSATFDSESVTFASGSYIDTGIAEGQDFTLFLVMEQINGSQNLLRCYTGGGISGTATTGLENVAFGFEYPRLKLDGTTGDATVGPLLQSSQLQSGPQISIFGYTTSGAPNTGFDFSPRYPEEGNYGTESEVGGGSRNVIGTNWIIGNSGAKIHFAAVKSGFMTYEEMCRLYRDAAYVLRERGVYI